MDISQLSQVHEIKIFSRQSREIAKEKILELPPSSNVSSVQPVRLMYDN